MNISKLVAIIGVTFVLAGCNSTNAYVSQKGSISSSTLGKGCAVAKVGGSLVISCSGESAIEMARVLQPTVKE